MRKLIAITAVLASFLLAAGCKPQASHPNQRSTFDGVAYDSLSVTRGALEGMRAPIASRYPKYIATFNEIASGYNQAAAVYALYHDGLKSEAEASAAVQQLALSFLLLDTKIAGELGASPSVEPRTVSGLQLITELQIVAAIAARIPATSEQADLASAILQGASGAAIALQEIANQPINTSTLTPIAVI